MTFASKTTMMRYYGGTVLREESASIEQEKRIRWWRKWIKLLLFPFVFIVWVFQNMIYFCLDHDEN